MARISPVTRDAVADKEKAAFDTFLQARGGELNSGPYSLLLHMPELAQHLETLRLYIRAEPSLAPRLMEIVMISVAREMNCAYIWYAHAAAARSAGVRGEIVDNIRERKSMSGLAADEQTVIDYTLELLRTRKVSKSTFDRALAQFGQRGTMTLTNLIACYAALAYNMNAFELEAPKHPTEPALPL